MLTSATELLADARARGGAVGAFQLYGLETCVAIVRAAEAVGSSVILQVGVPALKTYGVRQLAAICLECAREAAVGVAIQLDHCADAVLHEACLAAGFNFVMADAGHLPFQENVAFSRGIVHAAQSQGAAVEAELGKLTGQEDGASSEYAAQLTDPAQARRFIEETGCTALAVSIGNVHGLTPAPPNLDFERLASIRSAVDVPLVLHGASGLPDADIRHAIDLGVCKINVNTEVRQAFVDTLRTAAGDLLDVMTAATTAAQAIVEAKLRLFQAPTTSV